MKPLRVNLPYPDFSDIEPDRRIAEIIRPAYAGKGSELNAILQYIYHSLHFDNVGDKTTADILISIALAEMEHFKILGQLLLKLGADPMFAVGTPFGLDFYSANRISYSKTRQKMLLDDITDEMLAVKGYSDIISSIECEKVGAVIARIRLDEELHIVALKNRLSEIGCNI